MRITQLKAQRLHQDKVDARVVLNLYRVYAIVSLVFLYQTYALRTFLFEYADVRIDIAFLLWTSALLLLMLGRALRPALLVHFCAHLYLLQPLAHGMEIYLFHMPAFWSLFMFQEQRFWSWRLRTERVATWPLWCMGFALALWFSSAGTSKLLDPLWQRGEGLRLALSLPWLSDIPRVAFAGPSTPWALANYTVLFIEVFALPLYLFPASRRKVLLAIGLFFALLVWPFHLGFIGLFGLWIVTGANLGARPQLRRVVAQKELPGPYLSKLVLSPQFAIVILLIACLSWGYLLSRFPGHVFTQHPRIFFASTATAAAPNARNMSTERLTHDNTATLVTPTTKPSQTFARDARRYLKRALTASLHLSPMWIFTYRELLGLYEYRVVVVYEDGSTIEPIEVFRLDQRAGFESGSIFAPRWLQSSYYDFSNIPQQVEKTGSISPALERRILRLFRLAKQRVSEDQTKGQGSKVERVELLLSPILHSRRPQPWERVAVYWTNSKELRLLPTEATTEESFVIDGSWLFPALEVEVAQ